MKVQLDRDDPILGLEESGVTAEIVTTEDGFHRIEFTKDEKARFEDYLAQELELGIKDYGSVWDRALKNTRAYEALSDQDELLTLPLCKADANQIIAYIVDKIWNREPVFSVRPMEHLQYTVLVPGPLVQTPAGEQVRLSKQEKLWADQIATNLQRLIQHKIKFRLPFYETLVNIVTDCVKGASPSWAKLGYQRRTRTVRQPKVHDLGLGWVTVLGVEEVQIPVGEPHMLLSRSVFDIILPADAMDEQEAPWLAEDLKMDTLTFRKRVSAGDYALTAEEAKAILSTKRDLSQDGPRPDLSEIDGRKASQPRGLQDMYEVWVYWPLVLEDGTAGVYSLCTHFHRSAKKLCMAYLNPNQHGLRPYIPFFQRRRPHSFTGGSMVEDVAPFQKVASVAMHLQLNNAAQANMSAFFVRSGSKAWDWMRKNKVGPGSKVPFDKAEDVKQFPVGTNFRSLGPEIDYVTAAGSKLSVVSESDRGDIPNRSPVGTTERVQASGKLQPNMIVDGMRLGFGRLIKMLVQQIQQFDMYGESIPFTDPVSKASVMIPLRLPIDVIHDQFLFELSASSDDDTKEARLMRMMGAKKVLDEQRTVALQYMGGMFNPQTPPAPRKVLRRFLMGTESMAGEIIELSGSMDKARYVLGESEVDELLTEHDGWVKTQQEQQAQEPPQPPQMKVSLTGKLTPEEVDAAAAKLGIIAAPPQPQIGGAVEHPQVTDGNAVNGGAAPGPGADAGGAGVPTVQSPNGSPGVSGQPQGPIAGGVPGP